MEVIRMVTAAMGEVFAARPKPGISTAMAMARGMGAREELKQSEGGSLSAEEAAKELGITKAAVLKRYQKGQLLGWREAKQNAVRFPVWQFKENNVLPGLHEVLRVFQDAAWMDDWAKIVFFLGPLASRSGKRPLDLLRANEVSRSVEAARALME
ncbi:MAG: hypothetical protein V4726_12300 [Verrucomicrobiota bacterium]